MRKPPKAFFCLSPLTQISSFARSSSNTKDMTPSESKKKKRGQDVYMFYFCFSFTTVLLLYYFTYVLWTFSVWNKTWLIDWLISLQYLTRGSTCEEGHLGLHPSSACNEHFVKLDHVTWITQMRRVWRLSEHSDLRFWELQRPLFKTLYLRNGTR